MASVDSIEVWDTHDCIVDKFKIISNVGEFDLLILISGQLKIIGGDQQTSYILTYIAEKLAHETNKTDPQIQICEFIKNATIAKQEENGMTVFGSGTIYIFRQNRKSRNIRNFQIDFQGTNISNTHVVLKGEHTGISNYTCASTKSGRFPQLSEMELFKLGKIRSEVFEKLNNEEIGKLEEIYSSFLINKSKLSKLEALKKISKFQDAVLLLSEASASYGLKPFTAAPIRYFDIGRNGIHEITANLNLI